MGAHGVSLYLAGLDWIEGFGWVAALFTLIAYYMRTMLTFRVVALIANVFFLAYGFFADIYPTLVLHIVLLSLNVVRLLQIMRDTRRVRDIPLTADWTAALRPLMKETRFAAGTPLFRRGDAPDRMYLIAEGDVRLEEIDKTLGAGEILGEIGFFTEARERTLSATCATDCRLLVADEATFVKAYYQDPSLGLGLLKLVATRLHDNANRRETAAL